MREAGNSSRIRLVASMPLIPSIWKVYHFLSSKWGDVPVPLSAPDWSRLGMLEHH